MRKLISLLTILITSSSAPISVVACGNPITNDLNSLLNNCDLVVNSWGMPVPTEAEIDTAIHDKKPNFDVTAIRLENITASSAVVVPKDKTYIGKKLIKFTLEQQIPITDVIPNGQVLNTIIQTDGEEKPSDQQIKDVLANQFAGRLNLDAITFSDVTNNQASVNGNRTTYTGSTIIRYTINKSTTLKKVITNPNLGSISVPGQDKPDETTIRNILHTNFPKLIMDKIEVTVNSATNAVVTSKDPMIYTGPGVTLIFTTDKHYDFNKVLTDTNLGKIHINVGDDVPSDDQIKVALQADKKNPTLEINYISVSKIGETSALISSTDQSYYRGDPITVSFSLNKTMDLNQLIPANKRDLGVFVIDQPKPIPDGLLSRLADFHLNILAIKFENITPTSAQLVATDPLVYIGSITLTYTVDNSVPIDSVLKNTKLGTINTNGLPKPSDDTILNSVVSYNPKISKQYLTVTNATDKGATIVGDKKHYTGSIAVSFTCDNSTITTTLGYSDSKDYSATSGGTANDFDGDTQTILKNWTNYAKTWEEFTKAFPKLSFGKDAQLHTWMNTCDDKNLTGNQLDYDTSKIGTDKTQHAFLETIRYTYDHFWSPTWHANLDGAINIWHDNNNVYLQWHGTMRVSKIATRDSQFSINIPEAVFQR